MKQICNKKFYEESLKKYGVSPRGVHWKNGYTQYKRFEVLTRNLKDIFASSLVDAGCGTGEYYRFLKRIGEPPMDYAGIDSVEKMIDICRKRFPGQSFFHLDILKDPLWEADYYISSGAMNTLNFGECEKFIHKCYSFSKKGFVFNFLRGITFNRISKNDILGVCEKMCKNLDIQEGYLDNDFTIIMLK